MYRFIIIAVILFNTTFAQIGWNYQSPSLTNSVQFVNDFIGYATGSGHTIFKTEDGGETWSSLYTGISYSSENAQLGGGKIFFINTQVGWYVGQQNILLKTINGGSSWQRLQSGLIVNPNNYLVYNNVQFIDNNFGWVVGYTGSGLNSTGVILKTTDGGENWSHQLLGAYFSSVFFITPQKGWIVGKEGTIFATSDGGNSWNSQQSGVTNLLTVVSFKNETTGIIVGHGTVLVTSDGGANWVKKEVTTSSLSALSYLQSGLCYAAGGNGKLYKSNDNGNNWTLENDSTGGWYENSLFFTSHNTGWLADNKGLSKTTDSGSTWEMKINSAQVSKIFTLKSPLKIWGFKWEGLVHSPDGQRWSYYKNSLIKNMKDLFFKDPLNGWMVGGYNGQNNIIRTTDGGKTWAQQTNSFNRNFNSIFFVDSLYGWIAGNNGTIVQTLDGGETWGLQSTPTVAHLYGIAFANRQTGYAIGKGTQGIHLGKNVIMKTFNSGLLWNIIYVDSSDRQLTKIQVFDENTILVTMTNKIYKSVDGGTTWTPIFNEATNGLSDVSFYNIYNGWASGDVYLYKTNDGGATWKKNLNVIAFNSINFISPTKGWIASDQGILYTDDGGISSVEESKSESEVASGFIVNQNYPNPFNPSTVISFRIPEDSRVSIELFNILGEKIITLLDEYRHSGSHSVQFNTGRYKLASGTYICRIKTGEFTKSIKMSFVK